MLTSKEVLERTGISRATLNNYIAGGLVPRPEVLPPGPEDGAAPRIGYFPDDTIERIEAIQRLKREGWSIARIVEHLQNPQAPTPAPVTRGPSADTGPGLSLFQPAPLAAAPLAPAVPARRAPSLAPLAVLVSSLQDAPGLWLQLSAEEYFELVDEVWNELDAIFRGHGGMPARHPDEGMTSCFLAQRDHRYLWNALAAAHEAREAMQRLSLRWRERKAWPVELFMNSGLDAGEGWLGELGGGGLRVLGEAAQRAEQLSRLGSAGSILATRDLLGRLPPHDRARITFGVPRTGGEPHVLSTFSRLSALGLPAAVPAALADLSVAQVLDVRDETTSTGGHP
ncbi:MerR family transcriptional regulator [Ramlibacter albus]|uniref:MerR family transcriptional regulator n=1 Tax=Ramlibacter albus TaxID=2079448 RepID=A0A923M5Q8_9BURK|nr:MerR family transcriptional regulator [Ramlibacter albus]MBC5764343.1 MerR family transcriptional regulator [Ramlibacter albus]